MTKFRRKRIIKKVNEMIGWELPIFGTGAFSAFKDKGRIIVYVVISDGIVYAIDYKRFLARAIDGKVDMDDFFKCICYTLKGEQLLRG